MREECDTTLKRMGQLVRMAESSMKSSHHKGKESEIIMAVHSLYETDEAQQLRDSARGFLARYWPSDRALERAAQPEVLRELWQRAAAQGWTSLGLDAGMGGLREVLVLLEELGRAACPIPLLDAFVATTALKQVR